MPLSATVTIAGLRDTQVTGIPGTDVFWASRASALRMSVSWSETSEMSHGENTILGMRERMGYGLLETGAVTCGTAVAVMLAVPSKLPVTSPVCETRRTVESDENHTHVKPSVIGVFPASAVAVSCRVP